MKSALLDSKRLDQARDNFALLFYRWSQADAEKQAAEGFPLFSLLRDSLATKYLRTYKTLTEKDRSSFLRAMLKRTHLRAVELTGESPTEREKELIKQYLDPPWQNDREEREAEWNRPRLAAKDRKRLTELIQEQIAYETSGNFEIWLPGLFVFYRVIKPWRISTSIAIKNKQNLGYKHSISLEENPEIRLKEYTSITRWLGIGETNWSLMRPDELEECAEAPIILGKYFLDAIPELLAKITL